MSFVDKVRSFRKKNASNKQQKIILWTAIILASTYFITVTAMYQGQTQWAYVECPSESFGDCQNILYDCMNPPIATPVGVDNLCPNPDDQTKARIICAKYPSFCEYETIQKGTILGEKPPSIVEQMPSGIAAILLLGLLGYYAAGRKEKEKNNE